MNGNDVILNGRIVPSGVLVGSIREDAILSGVVAHSVGGTGEIYSGSYTVTPKVEDQTLATMDMIMSNDITVLKIPYYSVSNEHNGETIIIGGV